MLARKYPLMWLLVVTLLAGTGVGIWAIIKYAPTGAAVIAGVIAAAAGALGVTWKTVAVTLGKASVLLERPMVEDGLREAVKFAAFIRPVEMTPADMALLRKEVRIEGRKRPQRELGSSAEATVPPAEGNDAQGNAAPSADVPGHGGNGDGRARGVNPAGLLGQAGELCRVVLEDALALPRRGWRSYFGDQPDRSM